MSPLTRQKAMREAKANAAAAAAAAAAEAAAEKQAAADLAAEEKKAAEELDYKVRMIQSRKKDFYNMEGFHKGDGAIDQHTLTKDPWEDWTNYDRMIPGEIIEEYHTKRHKRMMKDLREATLQGIPLLEEDEEEKKPAAENEENGMDITPDRLMFATTELVMGASSWMHGLDKSVFPTQVVLTLEHVFKRRLKPLETLLVRERYNCVLFYIRQILQEANMKSEEQARFKKRLKVTKDAADSARDKLKTAQDAADSARDKLKTAQDHQHPCVACWAAPSEYAFMNCGHLSYCGNCLSEAKSKPDFKCPICRNEDGGVLKIHFS